MCYYKKYDLLWEKQKIELSGCFFIELACISSRLMACSHKHRCCRGAWIGKAFKVDNMVKELKLQWMWRTTRAMLHCGYISALFQQYVDGTTAHKPICIITKIHFSTYKRPTFRDSRLFTYILRCMRNSVECICSSHPHTLASVCRFWCVS